MDGCYLDRGEEIAGQGGNFPGIKVKKIFCSLRFARFAALCLGECAEVFHNKSMVARDKIDVTIRLLACFGSFEVWPSRSVIHKHTSV